MTYPLLGSIVQYLFKKGGLTHIMPILVKLYEMSYTIIILLCNNIYNIMFVKMSSDLKEEYEIYS